MTIYLYIKTHNKTGLKYLGKTEKKNPDSYKGSGVLWKKHIKKHGNDVSTEIIFQSDDKEKFKKVAIEYSKKFNIVESKNWANLKIEDGDGGDTSKTINYIKAMENRKSLKGEKNPMYGKSAIKENNLKWYTNDDENIYITEGTQPIGYYRGRSNLKRKPHSKEHKNKISKSLKGHAAPNARKVISPDGQIFLSIKKAADHLGMTTSQFRCRLVNKGDWKIM